MDFVGLSLCFWVISGVSYASVHCIISKGWAKKQQMKDCSGEETDLIKWVTFGGLVDTKIPWVCMGDRHTLGDLHSKLVIIARSTGLGF